MLTRKQRVGAQQVLLSPLADDDVPVAPCRGQVRSRTTAQACSTPTCPNDTARSDYAANAGSCIRRRPRTRMAELPLDAMKTCRPFGAAWMEPVLVSPEPRSNVLGYLNGISYSTKPGVARASLRRLSEHVPDWREGPHYDELRHGRRCRATTKPGAPAYNNDNFRKTASGNYGSHTQFAPIADAPQYPPELRPQRVWLASLRRPEHGVLRRQHSHDQLRN